MCQNTYRKNYLDKLIKCHHPRCPLNSHENKNILCLPQNRRIFNILAQIQQNTCGWGTTHQQPARHLCTKSTMALTGQAALEMTENMWMEFLRLRDWHLNSDQSGQTARAAPLIWSDWTDGTWHLYGERVFVSIKYEGIELIELNRDPCI